MCAFVTAEHFTSLSILPCEVPVLTMYHRIWWLSAYCLISTYPLLSAYHTIGCTYLKNVLLISVCMRFVVSQASHIFSSCGNDTAGSQDAIWTNWHFHKLHAFKSTSTCSGDAYGGCSVYSQSGHSDPQPSMADQTYFRQPVVLFSRRRKVRLAHDQGHHIIEIGSTPILCIRISTYIMNLYHRVISIYALNNQILRYVLSTCSVPWWYKQTESCVVNVTGASWPVLGQHYSDNNTCTSIDPFHIAVQEFIKNQIAPVWTGGLSQLKAQD